MSEKHPALKAAEKELQAAVSEQRRHGTELLNACCRRDTHRDTLRRRQPSWIDTPDQWAEYQRQIQALLTEDEGMIEFHNRHLNMGAERIADADRRVEAIERQLEGRLL